MTTFGYHAAHEQYPPSRLLEHVRAAEEAGFEGAMCSDHFHPWLEEQGQSGHAWAWLGAAMQVTGLSYGVVNAPGWRYHPAIIAQAAATLAEMRPGRFWLAVGSGEAINEAITGGVWPGKQERNQHLRECVQVIRALWAGETVTHRGRVTVEEARLYTLPPEPPMLFAAALSEATAEFAGGWADGLITIGGPAEQIERMRDAFARGGGEGKPIHVQHGMSWAPTEEDARRGAHEQWRFSVLGPEVLPLLRTPRQFAAATRTVTEEDVADRLRVSADLSRHAQWLSEYVEIGVDAVYLMNVHPRQLEFIELFGARVLPELGAASGASGFRR